MSRSLCCHLTTAAEDGQVQVKGIWKTTAICRTVLQLRRPNWTAPSLRIPEDSSAILTELLYTCNYRCDVCFQFITADFFWINNRVEIPRVQSKIKGFFQICRDCWDSTTSIAIFTSLFGYYHGPVMAGSLGWLILQQLLGSATRIRHCVRRKREHRFQL